jgi:hypothetical protein
VLRGRAHGRWNVQSNFGTARRQDVNPYGNFSFRGRSRGSGRGGGDGGRSFPHSGRGGRNFGQYHHGMFSQHHHGLPSRHHYGPQHYHHPPPSNGQGNHFVRKRRVESTYAAGESDECVLKMIVLLILVVRVI